MAGREEPIDDMAADESSAAGDENLHGRQTRRSETVALGRQRNLP
jgi:hypothetical protein